MEPRLAPSLSRMGFDRVYPVYYEISFELETENKLDIPYQNPFERDLGQVYMEPSFCALRHWAY